MDVESELRLLHCWDAEPPTLDALQSVEPFCVDTMEFYQWLQWIFLPRLYELLTSDLALPNQCSVAPMVEVWANSRALKARGLLEVLQKIDTLLSKN